LINLLVVGCFGELVIRFGYSVWLLQITSIIKLYRLSNHPNKLTDCLFMHF